MDYRQYDSTIGRFNVIDRLTELTYSITPYRFAFNNPIFFNDPTGLIEEGPMKHNDYYRIGGTVYFDPNVGPKNLPSGAVYIGKTYTDTKGTFWDEKGVPTYKAEELNEVVINANTSSDYFNVRDGMSIWGLDSSGNDSGLKGITKRSVVSSDIAAIGGSARHINGVSLFDWFLNLFKNSVDVVNRGSTIDSNNTTMDNSINEPVKPPLNSVEVSMRAFTYSVELNPYKVDTSSTKIKFSGKNATHQRDSLIKRNQILKNGAQYWLDNPN